MNINPLVCFTERYLDTDTNVQGIGDVAVPSEDFAWHEHVHGVLNRYFGDLDESAGDVVCGLVGLEITLQKARRIQRWLDREVASEEAEVHFREKDSRGDVCGYGENWLQTFQGVILAGKRKGDQIRRYTADEAAWSNMRGEMGFALVRGEQVIAYLITGKS